MTEIIEHADGTKRARIEHDYFGYAMMPDGCFFATVYSLDDRGAGAEVLGQDECVKSDLSSELAALWRDLRDMEDVEAVLRDQANICDECGEFIKRDASEQSGWRSATVGNCEDDAAHVPIYDFSDNPVVGFVYIERRDSKMVNIVTLADLKHWGFESVEDYQTTTGHDDPSHGNLTEWEAWADGEIYYVALEEKVTEYTRITDLAGRVLREEESVAWEEYDNSGCIYGYEWALESAKEQLADFVPAVGN